ncbi:MAG: transposase [bacterium]
MAREKTWFKLWITEGYSVRQLISISRRGIWKIKGTISVWLKRIPVTVVLNYSEIKYLLFDGTYFKHENCLMAAMDNSDGRIVGRRYCIRENYETAHSIFNELNNKGVLPKAITIDGNTSVIRAIKAVWPNITIQRCLAHIQRQGLSWLRRNPKLPAGKDLRRILLTVTEIKNEKDKILFIAEFEKWEKKYGESVRHLPADHKVFSDLRGTRSLLIHALPDMFHYLDDDNIPATTNKIEGYFSRLKIIYRQHRGLSKSHRQNFFNWYIYFKNNN